MRHRPENALRKADWIVDTCSFDQARALVEDLHYAEGSANTATFRHGLYRREEWPLVVSGCAMWMPPTKPAAQATFPDGDWRRVLALSRLAIIPAVPTNAASFMLAASARLIRQDGRWDMLVTYADEGQGHTGAIYLAAGWEYVGTTKPERVYTLNGRMVARKATKSRTHAEMLALGAICTTSTKRKFVKRLR